MNEITKLKLILSKKVTQSAPHWVRTDNPIPTNYEYLHRKVTTPSWLSVLLAPLAEEIRPMHTLGKYNCFMDKKGNHDWLLRTLVMHIVCNFKGHRKDADYRSFVAK